MRPAPRPMGLAERATDRTLTRRSRPSRGSVPAACARWVRWIGAIRGLRMAQTPCACRTVPTRPAPAAKFDSPLSPVTVSWPQKSGLRMEPYGRMVNSARAKGDGMTDQAPRPQPMRRPRVRVAAVLAVVSIVAVAGLAPERLGPGHSRDHKHPGRGMDPKPGQHCGRKHAAGRGSWPRDPRTRQSRDHHRSDDGLRRRGAPLPACRRPIRRSDRRQLANVRDRFNGQPGRRTSGAAVQRLSRRSLPVHRASPPLSWNWYTTGAPRRTSGRTPRSEI